ncbi:TonB-dependent receptor [Fibrella sp. HMF5335]|uniref:TonB-dependent receptor n=1 Tax=Fibrella rubiginis TaxID=2817060 RepID=A0A939GED1_9BACT|nr:TonB-dependent receptor [Fibrella rubiginis]MBO0935684.1 TonB-dependent receptor [Fibrella rubiginis]
MRKSYLQSFVTLHGVLLCWLLSVAVAQAQRVTGRVTSQEDGSALPGVSVVVKGSQRGTTTDATGNYSLETNGGQVLLFSFIGYGSREIIVGNQSIIDVTLTSDQRVLNEVVVIGYGSTNRARTTSSISTVNGAAISQLVTPSFDQQLAGRAAGVQVTVPSGILGQAPRIRIRGTNSITSGASPLVVVDGVPINTGNQSGVTNTNPLADINPQDIETYDVLKDGAATAIYGSRAANGVILITTKKGRQGAVRVNLNVTGGITNPSSRFNLLNPAQFVEIQNEKILNADPTAQPQAVLGDVTTNWQDYIFRTGSSQDYNLNVSGANEKSRYYFSLGFNNIVGSIKPNEQRRYSFTTNFDHTMNKFLQVGAKVQVAQTSNNGLNTGTNALSGNVSAAARLFPNTPIFDANNPTGYNISSDGAVLGRGPNLRNIDNNYTNIAFAIDNNLFRATTNRILANAFAQVNITDWLNIRSQIGTDYTNLRDFLSYDPRHGDGRGSNGIISQTSREVARWNWQNVLTLNRDFGQHNILLTLGNEYQKTNYASFTAGGSNFSDRFFLTNGLISGSYSTQTSSGSFTPEGFDSYFARLLYSYNDKYLASFSIRNDGISSLPIANRRGTFMGGSLGYRLSQEDFYKRSGVGRTLNDLKFRVSLAQVGNVDIGSFPYVGTFGASQYASQNGIGYVQAGNPDLRWESSTKFGAGIDFGLLNNQITGSVDYFNNAIDGLILAAPTAPSLGIPNNSISRNVGSMYNRGYELSLNIAAINKDNFRWNVGLNFSTIQNRITGLNKDQNGVDQPINFTYTINRVGSPISAIYGYQYAGVNPNNGNALYVKGNGQLVQRNASGAYSFYDVAAPGNFSAVAGAALSSQDVSTLDANGNIIGDRRILGNTNPTYFGGITNSFTYKGFDLEVFIRYSGGNKIMNVTRQETLLNQDFNNNGTEILSRWRKEGDITTVPRMVLNAGNVINFTGQAISRFVESGDFVRIQNISLGYNLPKSLFGTGQYIRSVRVFAQMQNAFTFTKYTGLDPELNANGDTNSQFGIDFNTNPQIRFVNFGANIGF